MSGHSKWSKIKHQKATGDAKKGQTFSKISKLIIVAAKKGGDPEMNLELKYAVNKAKAVNMPKDNIERAIKKGTGELQGESIEEAHYEAFGPGGCALLINAITDNKNRTTGEIKHILSKNNAKLAEPGSAAWAFEKSPDNTWKAKHSSNISEQDKEALKKLIETLEENEDVQSIFSNVDIIIPNSPNSPNF